MNNYFPKNIKALLTQLDTILLEYDPTTLETVILGGCVSNISNLNTPSLSGTTDYFTLKIYNSQTEETTILYDEIPIAANSIFPFGKIYFNEYNQLIASSAYSDNLQISISYFYVMNYDNGVVKVDFQPSNVLTFLPTWTLLNQTDEHTNFEYVPVLEGLQTIQFNTILGWQKPEDIDINIQKLKTTTVTTKYTLLDSTITFFTTQPDLIDLFQWKLTTESIWLNNNDVMTITPDTYEFEFIDIDLYDTPPNIIIDAEEKKIYSQNISYTRTKSLVTVNLEPSALKIGDSYALNNQWRLIYPNGSFSPWYNSGESILFNINTGYILDIMTNEYCLPSQTDISFDLLQNVPVIFNIDMLFTLITNDDYILEGKNEELIVAEE